MAAHPQNGAGSAWNSGKLYSMFAVTTEAGHLMSKTPPKINLHEGRREEGRQREREERGRRKGTQSKESLALS